MVVVLGTGDVSKASSDGEFDFLRVILSSSERELVAARNVTSSYYRRVNIIVRYLHSADLFSQRGETVIHLHPTFLAETPLFLFGLRTTRCNDLSQPPGDDPHWAHRYSTTIFLRLWHFLSKPRPRSLLHVLLRSRPLSPYRVHPLTLSPRGRSQLKNKLVGPPTALYASGTQPNQVKYKATPLMVTKSLI